MIYSNRRISPLISFSLHVVYFTLLHFTLGVYDMVGVGKSSLVLRFVTNNFKPYSESTIGASFMSKQMVVQGILYCYYSSVC